jgi:hypothetical protein
LEGSRYEVLEGVILAFLWNDCGKALKTSVRVADSPFEILTGCFCDEIHTHCCADLFYRLYIFLQCNLSTLFYQK